jgi:SCY1-like protein 2
MESCEDLMPDLDFLAPEFAIEDDDILSPATDMFSLGMLAFTLHNSKPLFTNSGSWNNYRRNCTELKNLRESNLQLIPHELRDTLKLLLHATPGLRPTASECAKVAYFDDVGVRTLANLDAQFQWDNLQKSQFYKGLPQVLPRLPQRVSVHRVVPCLAKEFVNPHMVPFVLPSVLTIAEEASQKDFVNFILPSLKPVLKLTDPIQILLIFMQRMDMLLSKTPPADVKSDVLPMIYRALESDTAQIQELCLSIIPGFAGLLDFNAIKTALLPRIKRLILNTSLLSVRVNGLICIGKLLSHLDKWMVTDEILPLLQQVPSREPAVIMACIGILKLTVSDAKLALSKEIVANKVLPYLFPLSIENGLSVVQYSAVMTLIRELIDRVETEHKAKLEQLSSIQNEQRSALQINSSDSSQLKSGQPSSNSTTKNSELDQVFNGLGLGSYVSPPPATNSNSGNNLSLSDKQKLLKDSEKASKLASQPQLKPHKTMATKSSSQTKI